MEDGLSGVHGEVVVLHVESVRNQEVEHVPLQNHGEQENRALVKMLKLKIVS